MVKYHVIEFTSEAKRSFEQFLNCKAAEGLELVFVYHEMGCGIFKENVEDAGPLLNRAVLEKQREIERLTRLIVEMTHHEGALEETREVWLPVVQDYLSDSHFRRSVLSADISEYIEESIEVCKLLANKYGIHPLNILKEVPEGSFLRYQNIEKNTELIITVDSEIALVVTDYVNKAIIYSEDIKDMDFSSAIDKFLGYTGGTQC